MKISIITINWNNAVGLERTIRSVVEQSYGNIEYIVIDGASADNSVEVIKKYADKISYWTSEKDNGIYNAMNKGVDAASGDYCLFLNSGDKLLAPDSLANVLKSSDLVEDIISCDLFTDNGKLCNFRSAPRIKPTQLYISMYNPFPHPSTLIKTSLIKKFRYNEESKIAGDWMFFYDAMVADNATYRHIPIPLSLFYLDGVSSQGGNPKGRAEGIEYLYKYMHPNIVSEIKDQKPRKEYLLANSSMTLGSTGFNILYFTYELLIVLEYRIKRPIRSLYKNYKYKHSK